MCQYGNWEVFAITFIGEANLGFQFWKYGILQWTGLAIAKRRRDKWEQCAVLLKLDATTSKDRGD
jgi:hypothetical protein